MRSGITAAQHINSFKPTTIFHGCSSLKKRTWIRNEPTLLKQTCRQHISTTACLIWKGFRKNVKNAKTHLFFTFSSASVATITLFLLFLLHYSSNRMPQPCFDSRNAFFSPLSTDMYITAGGRPCQLRLYCVLYMTCFSQDGHCKAFFPCHKLCSFCFVSYTFSKYYTGVSIQKYENSLPANMTHP